MEEWKVFEYWSLGMSTKRRLYKGVVIPTALHMSETWNMGAREKRLNIMKMRRLRNMCGVTQVDQVRNDEVWRTGVAKTLAEQAEQGVLQWFGHVERIEEEHLVKKTTRSDMRGVRPRGRLQMGWLDSVKRALSARGMSVKQGRMVVHDRNRCGEGD